MGAGGAGGGDGEHTYTHSATRVRHMKARLTLTIDADLVPRAKAWAAEQGMSRSTPNANRARCLVGTAPGRVCIQSCGISP